MLQVRILSPKEVVFEGEAESVFVPGDAGEFEIMPHHAPLVSLLVKGDIILDWRQRIPVEKGIVKCLNNECVILMAE